MSLNRCEQAMFDYWKVQPDERRHWQDKVVGAAVASNAPSDLPRILERDLWDYLVERSEHVGTLRAVLPRGARRVSLLNLAEHIIRLWTPPPKQKISPPP